jgi:hypothetical protein
LSPTRDAFVAIIANMTTRTRILFLVLAWLVALPGSAAARTDNAPVALTLRPVEDVSFPFWCDWSYDWEERCWWEDGDRLPIGGDSDKVWRGGLRFSLSAIPPGATILDASLTVRHDVVCFGPRRTTRPCRARRYTIDLHPILTASWFSEREVEVGPLVSRAVLPLATRPEWLSWDMTGLVESWVAGEPNDGVLLKLADAEEDFDVGGPAVPSSSFAGVASRPALDIVYLPPGG